MTKQLLPLRVVGLALFLFTLTVGVAGFTKKAEATTVGNQEVITVPVDQYNNTTQALLWLPDTYTTDGPSTTYPLIINLHGAGDAGTDINQLLNPALLSRLIADGFKPEAVNPVDGVKYKFIVVSPHAGSWSYSYPAVKAIITNMSATYRVNPDRIYVTGLSAGGQGAWSSVTDDATNSINLAAIAPMSAATLGSSQVPNVVNAATNNIGVWSVMGGADGFLSSTQDYTNRVNAANPARPALLTVLNGVGHSAWIEGFDDLWHVNGMNIFEWMLTYKRGTPNPANALPTIALTAPTNTTVVVAPQNITLTATASDSDGSVAKVEFFNGRTLIGTATTAPYTYTWANPGVGTYAVFARVTDNNGAISNSDTAHITVLAQANQSAPFGGTAWTIPGTIQAEDYDIGGQGIAYNDSTSVNSGNWYRPYESVDSELVPAEGANQYYIGWPAAGEWMKYTVNVTQSGVYTLQARVASPYAGKSFTIDVDGVTVATVNPAQTADWNTYQTISVPNVSLTAGTHVMRIYDVTDGFNLNWVSFTLSSGNQLPVANAGIDQTITLPTNSVTLNGSGTDTDGTIAAYAWTKVSGSGTITTPSAASTTITGLAQGTSTFRLTVTDNNNGTAYDDVVITVSGQTTPTPYSGTPIAIPGTVQVEDYDNGGEGVAYHDLTAGNSGNSYRTSEGVDIEYTSYDNGYDLGWTNTGEWTKYTVNVATTGTYALQARVATPNAGKSFSIEMDGTPIATVTVPSTGWWQTWQTTPAQNVSLTAGTHVMKLTVLAGSPTDNDGFNVNWISFSAAAANQAPIVNAGVDQSITLPTSSVTLSGTANDPENTAMTYLWEQVSGPTATITTPSALSTTVTNLVQGTYTFKLTATDVGNLSASDTMVVTVNAAQNIAPTANAGVDQTITLPTSTVTLSGSGADSDGTIASYAWSVVSGSGSITSPSSASTTITGLTQGTSTFRLTVTDNQGATATDDVVITVNGQIVESPYGGTARTIPGTIEAEDFDLGGEGLAYHDNETTNQGWQYRSEGVDIGTDEGGYIVGWTVIGEWMKYMVNVQTTGLYTPQVRVASPYSGKSFNLEIDGTVIGTVVVPQTGAWNVYQTVTLPNVSLTAGAHVMRIYEVTNGFNVNWVSFATVASNQAPTANAGIDQTITLPTNSVTLSGSGTDTDGTIASYAWSVVSGSGTITTPTSASTTITGLTQGTSTFRLTVTDNQGATATDDVVITVNVAANIPPTANAGIDQTITLPTNSVTLNGSGTDSDGTIASYTWSVVSGSGTITSPASASTTVTGLTQGLTTLRLTVTDNQDATATDDMIVTVNTAANVPPTSNAGLDQTITLPTNSVTLNGSGTDSDGTISSYAWSVVSGAGSITSPASASTTVTGLTQGTSTLRLTVTDNQGATATDDVIITVNAAPNVAPTANAGVDQTITLPTNSVTLNGSGTDSDGTITAYAWTKVSGSGAITTPTAATTTITGLTQGTSTFRLTVTDNNGATATDDIIVTVNALVESPYGGTARAIPGKIELEDYDNGGEGVAYHDLTAGNSGNAYRTSEGVDVEYTSYDNGYDLGWTNTGEWLKYMVNVSATGTYTLQVRAATPNSGKSFSIAMDGTTVATVTVPNTKGWQTWQTAIIPNVSLTAGAHVMKVTVLSGSATDAAGFNLNWLNFVTNMAPTANAGADKTITLPTSSVTLAGSGTDADGTIASYLWTKVSGTGGTITSPNAATTTITGLTAGSYTYRLKVTDNKGATGSDDVIVTVK